MPSRRPSQVDQVSPVKEPNQASPVKESNLIQKQAEEKLENDLEIESELDQLKAELLDTNVTNITSDQNGSEMPRDNHTETDAVTKENEDDPPPNPDSMTIQEESSEVDVTFEKVASLGDDGFRQLFEKSLKKSQEIEDGQLSDGGDIGNSDQHNKIQNLLQKMIEVKPQLVTEIALKLHESDKESESLTEPLHSSIPVCKILFRHLQHEVEKILPGSSTTSQQTKKSQDQYTAPEKATVKNYLDLSVSTFIHQWTRLMGYSNKTSEELIRIRSLLTELSTILFPMDKTEVLSFISQITPKKIKHVWSEMQSGKQAQQQIQISIEQSLTRQILVRILLFVGQQTQGQNHNDDVEKSEFYQLWPSLCACLGFTDGRKDEALALFHLFVRVKGDVMLNSDNTNVNTHHYPIRWLGNLLQGGQTTSSQSDHTTVSQGRSSVLASTSSNRDPLHPQTTAKSLTTEQKKMLVKLIVKRSQQESKQLELWSDSESESYSRHDLNYHSLNDKVETIKVITENYGCMYQMCEQEDSTGDSGSNLKFDITDIIKSGSNFIQKVGQNSTSIGLFDALNELFNAHFQHWLSLHRVDKPSQQYSHFDVLGMHKKISLSFLVQFQKSLLVSKSDSASESDELNQYSIIQVLNIFLEYFENICNSNANLELDDGPKSAVIDEMLLAWMALEWTPCTISINKKAATLLAQLKTIDLKKAHSDLDTKLEWQTRFQNLVKTSISIKKLIFESDDLDSDVNQQSWTSNWDWIPNKISEILNTYQISSEVVCEQLLNLDESVSESATSSTVSQGIFIIFCRNLILETTRLRRSTSFNTVDDLYKLWNLVSWRRISTKTESSSSQIQSKDTDDILRAFRILFPDSESDNDNDDNIQLPAEFQRNDRLLSLLDAECIYNNINHNDDNAKSVIKDSELTIAITTHYINQLIDGERYTEAKRCFYKLVTSTESDSKVIRKLFLGELDSDVALNSDVEPSSIDSLYTKIPWKMINHGSSDNLNRKENFTYISDLFRIITQKLGSDTTVPMKFKRYLITQYLPLQVLSQSDQFLGNTTSESQSLCTIEFLPLLAEIYANSDSQKVTSLVIQMMKNDLDSEAEVKLDPGTVAQTYAQVLLEYSDWKPTEFTYYQESDTEQDQQNINLIESQITTVLDWVRSHYQSETDSSESTSNIKDSQSTQSSIKKLAQALRIPLQKCILIQLSRHPVDSESNKIYQHNKVIDDVVKLVFKINLADDTQCADFHLMLIQSLFTSESLKSEQSVSESTESDANIKLILALISMTFCLDSCETFTNCLEQSDYFQKFFTLSPFQDMMLCYWKYANATNSRQQYSGSNWISLQQCQNLMHSITLRALKLLVKAESESDVGNMKSQSKTLTDLYQLLPWDVLINQSSDELQSILMQESTKSSDSLPMIIECLNRSLSNQQSGLSNVSINHTTAVISHDIRLDLLLSYCESFSSESNKPINHQYLKSLFTSVFCSDQDPGLNFRISNDYQNRLLEFLNKLSSNKLNDNFKASADEFYASSLLAMLDITRVPVSYLADLKNINVSIDNVTGNSSWIDLPYLREKLVISTLNSISMGSTNSSNSYSQMELIQKIDTILQKAALMRMVGTDQTESGMLISTGNTKRISRISMTRSSIRSARNSQINGTKMRQSSVQKNSISVSNQQLVQGTPIQQTTPSILNQQNINLLDCGPNVQVLENNPMGDDSELMDDSQFGETPVNAPITVEQGPVTQVPVVVVVSGKKQDPQPLTVEDFVNNVSESESEQQYPGIGLDQDLFEKILLPTHQANKSQRHKLKLDQSVLESSYHLLLQYRSQQAQQENTLLNGFGFCEALASANNKNNSMDNVYFEDDVVDGDEDVITVLAKELELERLGLKTVLGISNDKEKVQMDSLSDSTVSYKYFPIYAFLRRGESVTTSYSKSYFKSTIVHLFFKHLELFKSEIILDQKLIQNLQSDTEETGYIRFTTLFYDLVKCWNGTEDADENDTNDLNIGESEDSETLLTWTSTSSDHNKLPLSPSQTSKIFTYIHHLKIPSSIVRESFIPYLNVCYLPNTIVMGNSDVNESRNIDWVSDQELSEARMSMQLLNMKKELKLEIKKQISQQEVRMDQKMQQMAGQVGEQHSRVQSDNIQKMSSQILSQKSSDIQNQTATILNHVQQQQQQNQQYLQNQLNAAITNITSNLLTGFLEKLRIQQEESQIQHQKILLQTLDSKLDRIITNSQSQQQQLTQLETNLERQLEIMEKKILSVTSVSSEGQGGALSRSAKKIFHQKKVTGSPTILIDHDEYQSEYNGRGGDVSKQGSAVSLLEAQQDSESEAIYQQQQSTAAEGGELGAQEQNNDSNINAQRISESVDAQRISVDQGPFDISSFRSTMKSLDRLQSSVDEVNDKIENVVNSRLEKIEQWMGEIPFPSSLIQLQSNLQQLSQQFQESQQSSHAAPDSDNLNQGHYPGHSLQNNPSQNLEQLESKIESILEPALDYYREEISTLSAAAKGMLMGITCGESNFNQQYSQSQQNYQSKMIDLSGGNVNGNTGNESINENSNTSKLNKVMGRLSPDVAQQKENNLSSSLNSISENFQKVQQLQQQNSFNQGQDLNMNTVSQSQNQTAMNNQNQMQNLNQTQQQHTQQSFNSLNPTCPLPSNRNSIEVTTGMSAPSLEPWGMVARQSSQAMQGFNMNQNNGNNNPNNSMNQNQMQMMNNMQPQQGQGQAASQQENNSMSSNMMNNFNLSGSTNSNNNLQGSTDSLSNSMSMNPNNMQMDSNLNNATGNLMASQQNQNNSFMQNQNQAQAMNQQQNQIQQQAQGMSMNNGQQQQIPQNQGQNQGNNIVPMNQNNTMSQEPRQSQGNTNMANMNQNSNMMSNNMQQQFPAAQVAPGCTGPQIQQNQMLQNMQNQIQNPDQQYQQQLKPPSSLPINQNNHMMVGPNTSSGALSNPNHSGNLQNQSQGNLSASMASTMSSDPMAIQMPQQQQNINNYGEHQPMAMQGQQQNQISMQPPQVNQYHPPQPPQPSEPVTDQTLAQMHQQARDQGMFNRVVMPPEAMSFQPGLGMMMGPTQQQQYEQGGPQNSNSIDMYGNVIPNSNEQNQNQGQSQKDSASSSTTKPTDTSTNPAERHKNIQDKLFGTEVVGAKTTTKGTKIWWGRVNKEYSNSEICQYLPQVKAENVQVKVQ